MNDKNLLERLGIIQRVDDIDDDAGETPEASVSVAEISAETIKTETAPEIAPTVSSSVPELHFVSKLDDAENIDEPSYDVNNPADFIPSYVVNTEVEEEKTVEKIDTEPVVNKGETPSVEEIADEPITYETAYTAPVVSPEPEYVPEAYVPEPMPVETQYAEPEEITLPVIDRETLYSQIAQETMAQQQSVETKQPFNTDKYSSISDLYKSYGKKLSGTDTIFIVDAFIKSLPDTLSINLKRQSVLNIIAASNINLEELVADGLSRMDNLNNFFGVFKQHTEQVLADREAQISHLEQQISVLKREVKERNRLQEKQEAAIDFETQKIKASLEFIANNDIGE